MFKHFVKTIFLTNFIIVIYIMNAISQDSVMDQQIHQRFVQAQKMMGKKNYDQAIAAFKEIIKDNPGFGKAYEWLVLAFAYGQRATEAQKYWQSLLEQDSLNACSHFGVGRWYQETGDNKLAILSYKKSIKLGCKYPSLYFNAAVVWRSLSKLEEANSVFEKLSQQKRYSHLAHYAMAYVYYLESKWTDAEQQIDLALQAPDFAEAELLKAMILNQPGGRHEYVIEICKVGVERADLNLKLQLKADFLSQLNRAYRHRGSNSDALESLEKALQLYKDIGNLSSEGVTLGKLAGLYRRHGHLKQALTYYKQSLEILKQIRGRRSEGTFLNGLAIVYTKLGKYEKAIENYERAIVIAREVGGVRSEANASNNLGNLLSDQGKYRQASEYYEKALRLFREIGIKRAEAALLINLGVLAESQGEYQRALQYYQQGLNAAQALKSKVYEAGVRANRGDVYNYLGHYAKALEEYQAALDIFTEIDNKPFKASVLGSMADIQRQLGNYEAALNFIQQALVIVRDAGSKREEGLKYESLGIIYTDTGNYSRALEYYRKALKIQEELKNKPSVSYIMANMGVVFGFLGEHSQALHHYEKSLNITREIGEKRNEGYVCNHLGSYYFNIQDYDKSEEFHKRALRIGEEISVPEIIWDAKINLSIVHGEQGHIEDAWTQYKDAMRTIEEAEKNILDKEHRVGFRERRDESYEQLMSMLWELHQQESAKGFDREMFSFAERTKARSLLELVNEGSIFQYLDDVSADFRRRFLANANKLVELREQLHEVISQADSSSEQSVQRELRTAQTQRAKLFADLEQKYPRYQELIMPDVLTLEQVQQKVLQQDQILIQYVVGEERTFVFTLASNDFSITVLETGRQELARMFTEISPLFQRKEEPPLLTIKDNMGNAPVRKDANWGQINLDELLQLYKRIFEPAMKGHSLESTELIIVPDDILFYFPFEMLVTKFEQGKPRFLIEDHPISYSASASLLNPALQRQKKPNRELLAFGNPTFGKESNTGVTDIFARLFKSVFREGQWIPLPYSEDEVRNIAKNFKDSEILIGKRATEENFKQNVGQFRYFHVATHYLADDRQPMFSKMVFAQASDNTEEDGYLHTFEVFNLDLNAELVTLSACNTALGQFRRGEGLMGISRAFMYAGVPSLVVSLWPVEDESTAYLMSQFYKYLAQGEAKNVALQKAKIDLIKSDLEKNDPFYWAPFVLIGDWK